MKTREVILKGMGIPNASHKVPKKIIIRKIFDYSQLLTLLGIGSR